MILLSGNFMTGILKVAFIVSAFFVVYSPTQGYVDSQGLVDGNHRELIRAEYKQIQYLGHGIYMVFPFGSEVSPFLCNRDGNRLKFKVPEGCFLKRVLWFGEAADADPHLELNDLSAKTILIYVTKQGLTGLCSIDGRVIIVFADSTSPNNMFIECINGVAEVSFSEKDTDGGPNHIVRRLFDCRTRKLKKILNLDNYLSNQSNQLNDGFAIWKNAVESQSGYFDTSGKTMTDLRTFPFYGDYAVACIAGNGQPKFGVVNRSFRFVSEPKYTYLIPKFFERGFEFSLDCYLPRPVFYLGKLENQQVLLNLKGEEILRLPERHFVVRVYPDQVLLVAVKPEIENYSPNFVYMNMKGEIVDYPKYSIENGRRVRYLKVAEDRFIQIVSEDTGKFDSAYWKKHADFPVSRYEMLRRFAKEHKIIGMTRSELESNLGEYSCLDGSDQAVQYKDKQIEAMKKYPVCSSYWLRAPRGTCLPVKNPSIYNSLSLHFHFDKNDRVACWYTNWGPLSEPVFEDGVELPSESSFQVMRPQFPYLKYPYEPDPYQLLGRSSK